MDNSNRNYLRTQSGDVKLSVKFPKAKIGEAAVSTEQGEDFPLFCRVMCKTQCHSGHVMFHTGPTREEKAMKQTNTCNVNTA